MKILVCVKQVSDSEADIQIDDSGKWVKLAESVEFRMNRFDEYATEEAILIKEAHPGTMIDIVSVGPERVTKTIKRALGMGCDNGIHIVTDEEGYLSPFLTASWIASAARERQYDLILAGVMSEDAMQGLVGPMVAETLGIPCATSVVAAEIAPAGASVLVKREIEGGYKDLLELPFPALLSIQSGINKPRYPSLSNIIRANKVELETIPAATFSEQAARERISRVGRPQQTRSALVLHGTPQEKAAQLLDIIGTKISIR